MNKSFYLIRHGDKIKTIGDPALTERGVAQAQATADFLKSKSISAIFTSPFLRTQQTAEIIGKTLTLPVTIEPLLRERANWGDDPNQSLPEFLAMWYHASLDRDWQPSVGDSSIHAGQRLQMVIERLAPDFNNVVLVTHGGLISDFVLNMFDTSVLDQVVAGFSIMRDAIVKECSITQIGYDPTSNTYALDSLVNCAHLESVT